jgi:hypothetical protein
MCALQDRLGDHEGHVRHRERPANFWTKSREKTAPSTGAAGFGLTSIYREPAAPMNVSRPAPDTKRRRSLHFISSQFLDKMSRNSDDHYVSETAARSRDIPVPSVSRIPVPSVSRVGNLPTLCVWYARQGFALVFAFGAALQVRRVKSRFPGRPNPAQGSHEAWRPFVEASRERGATAARSRRVPLAISPWRISPWRW